MINLLPPGAKENMMYARKNSILLKWIIVFIIALSGVGVIVAGGQLYLAHSINATSDQLNQTNQALQDQKIDDTQAKLQEISSDTKLVLQVLSREVLFSNLLRQLGSSIPTGTILTSFQVDKLQGGLTLTALATNINSATQLQLNLQDPANKIFDKSDIESINCISANKANGEEPSPTTVSESNLKYPCTVQIRALFAKDNPYLYINPEDIKGLIGESQ